MYIYVYTRTRTRTHTRRQARTHTHTHAHRDGSKVKVPLVDIHLNFPRGLRDIGVEEDFVRATDLADLLHWLVRQIPKKKFRQITKKKDKFREKIQTNSEKEIVRATDLADLLHRPLGEFLISPSKNYV